MLSAVDFHARLDEILAYPARQVVNPLISFLHHGDAPLKWRAVTVLGVVVAAHYETEPESARVVMRRLIWNLNDESGGIGWGSPEAMGEILARSGGLAAEYASILISYIDPAGNYLEHELLQCGLLWGIGRLANARAALVADALPLIFPFLSSKNPVHRGFAAWAAGAVPGYRPPEHLTNDRTPIGIYLDGNAVSTTIGRLALLGRHTPYSAAPEA